MNANMPSKRIYIMDDDPDILDSMRMILEFRGYSVETALDGERIDQLNDHLPDLFLIDIWMSGVSGLEICKRLKMDQRTKHIPVVMVSANISIKDLSEQCNANDYLPKPFELTQLVGMVEKYTGGKLN